MDIEMLESAKFRLFTHQDDDEREYTYKMEQRMLAIAKEKNFIMISMKNDWKKIFFR